jgi:hypothetical protein
MKTQLCSLCISMRAMQTHALRFERKILEIDLSQCELCQGKGVVEVLPPRPAKRLKDMTGIEWLENDLKDEYQREHDAIYRDTYED